MKGLIYKEIILYGKQALLFLGAVILLSSIMFAEPPADSIAVVNVMICVIYMFIFLVVGMFEQGLYEKDENYRWRIFISSTPKLMKTQILVKYMSTLFISVCTLIWCIVLERMVELRGGIELKTIQVCIIMLGIQMMFRAVEIPVVIRFGSKYASLYRMIVTFMVMSVVLIYLLFGNLEIFCSREQFFRFILKLLEGDKKQMLWRWCTYTVVTSGILYVLSYKISVLLGKEKIYM